MNQKNQDSSATSKTLAQDPETPNIVNDFTQYITDFNDAYNYVRNSYHTLWYDCYRIYNNKRVNIGYAGVNDAFVPETFTIVESLVANIAGGTPKFGFLPTTDEQKQDTEVLTNLCMYYWECNRMGIKVQQWVRDMILYGNGVLHITWDAKRQIPCVDYVPLRDFFIDPAATSLDNARYAGFRYLADKEVLRKMKVLDPKTNQYVNKYDLTALDEVENDSKLAGEPLDKQKKEQMVGSTLGSQNTRQVEIILMYYMDTGKVVEIANRAAVIRNVDTPFQMDEKTQPVSTEVNGQMVKSNKKIPGIKAFLPFAILRNYTDPSLFFARGDVEVIMPRQETLNDVENMDLDNVSFANNVMWQIDPQYADLVPEIESIPGAVYPIPKNALSVIERPTLSQDLDAKKQEIKDEMRRATAADEVIQGASQAQGRVTATEVSSQLTQSKTRFSTKVNNLESEGYAQLASIMFKLTQIFVSQEQVVRIVGPEGVHFKDYDPYEFSGDYEPHVKLDTTIKQQTIEQDQKMNQIYTVMQQSPAANQAEVLRFILTKLGAETEDIQRILTPAPEAAPKPAPPKVSVSLKGELNPLQEQDLAMAGGFGGDKSAQTIADTPGLEMPNHAPAMDPGMAAAGMPGGLPSEPAYGNM